MKKTVHAFYKYTIKMQKYTQDKKDYYLRCLMHFFVRYTYLNPIDLYNELEKQIDESKDYNQTFIIDGKEWWIVLEKDLNDYRSIHDREEKNKNLEMKIKTKNKAVARYFRKTVSELYSLIQDYELPYKLNVELDSNSDFWTEEFTQVHQINYSKKI